MKETARKTRAEEKTLLSMLLDGPLTSGWGKETEGWDGRKEWSNCLFASEDRLLSQLEVEGEKRRKKMAKSGSPPRPKQNHPEFTRSESQPYRVLISLLTWLTLFKKGNVRLMLCTASHYLLF